MKFQIGSSIIVLLISASCGYVTTYEDDFLLEQESRAQIHTGYGDVPKYQKSFKTILYPDSLEMLKVYKKRQFDAAYGEYILKEVKYDTIPRAYPYIAPLDTLNIQHEKELSGRYSQGGVIMFMGYDFIDSVHFRWVFPIRPSSTGYTPPEMTHTMPIIKNSDYSGVYSYFGDTVLMFTQRPGTV
ncbi:MAG: hypothetical protein AB8B56_12455, partial [Crocinitomicaceae bacterium]